MAQTEVTIQVNNSVNQVIDKLKNLGFVETESISGEDCYFSTLKQDEIKNASYKELIDSSVIVRTVLSSEDNKQTTKLMFKKKDIDASGNVVDEKKISTLVQDGQKAIDILKFSGLSNWVNVKQENHFLKNGEREITVGTVENLGVFIEIEEYPSISKLDKFEKFNELVSYIDSFGFDMVGNDYSCKKAFMLYKRGK